MKLKYLLSTLSLLSFTFMYSQTQYSAYTAVGKGVATTFLTDYQSLGINSSALGWGTGYENKKVTLGTSEFGFGISSPALDEEKLRNATTGLFNTVFDRENSEFDLDKQRAAAGEYAEAGIAIDADYNWFGASYQDEKFGGIAATIRESYNWNSQINQETSDIIFRGRLSSYFDSLTVVNMDGDTSVIANSGDLSPETMASVINGISSNPKRLSELTEGSSINMSWNREFNFGYGRKVVGDSSFALYAGVGGRYIQSVAMFNFESDEDGVRMYSAVSPFYEIDYGSVDLSNPSSFPTNEGTLPTIAGSGYGLDASLSVMLLKKIRLAVAVNNIGSVTYDRNVYTLENSDALIDTLNISGLQDYDVTEAMGQLLRDGSIFNLVGEEQHTITNPATFRLGGSMELGKKINVGFDFVAPFNRNSPGSIQNPIVSVGGDVKVTDWLHLSAGYYGGGVYAHNVPLGVNFVLGGGAYEFGIASRDALSFFLENSNSISGGFGFARVRF